MSIDSLPQDVRMEIFENNFMNFREWSEWISHDITNVVNKNECPVIETSAFNDDGASGVTFQGKLKDFLSTENIFSRRVHDLQKRELSFLKALFLHLTWFNSLFGEKDQMCFRRKKHSRMTAGITMKLHVVMK